MPRAPERKQPEHQRHHGRAHALARAGATSPACRLRRRHGVGGAAVRIARLFGVLKKPKPMPQISMRQTMSNVVGMRRQQRHQRQAGRHHGQAAAAEQPGRIAIGQPSGERRDHRHRERPGRQQQTRSPPGCARACSRTETAATPAPCSARRTSRSRSRPTARTTGCAADRPAASATSAPVRRVTSTKPNTSARPSSAPA